MATGYILPLALIIPTYSIASFNLVTQDFLVFLFVMNLYGLLVLLDGGVGRALIIFFRKKLDFDDEKVALFNAFLLSTIILSSATILLILVTFGSLHWFDFDRKWLDRITHALPQIYAGGLATGLFLTVSAFLECKLKFTAAMLARTVFTGSFYMSAIVGFGFGFGLEAVISLMAITRIMFLAIFIYKFCEIRIIHFNFQSKYFHDIRKICIPIFVSNTPGIIIAFFERLAPISLPNPTASSLTTYLATIDIYGKALVAPMSVNRSVFPDIAHRGLYSARQGLFFAILAMFLVATIIFLSSFWLTPKIFEFWISLEMSFTDRIIVILMSATFGLTVINQVLLNALQASQRSRELSILQFAELIVFIVTFLVLTSQFGLLGVVGSSLLRAALDLLGLSFLCFKQYRRMRAFCILEDGDR